MNLKLTKKGSTLTGFYSFDNESWTQLGIPKSNTAIGAGDASELKVGLYAVNGTSKPGAIPATFENFILAEGENTEGTLVPFATAGSVPAAPSTTLNSASSVSAGQQFDVTFGMSGLTEGVYAQDITLNYDPNVFEYISAISVREGVSLLEAVNVAAGELRFILASQGAGNAVVGDAQLFEVTFKAKNISQPTAGTITVSDARLGDEASNEIEAVSSSVSVQVTVGIPGDMNNDGRVSIGDLAIIAAHYGKSVTSPDWEQVKKADVNQDGKIDILDLTFVAKKII